MKKILLLLALVCSMHMQAAVTTVETNGVHTAAGNNGCTVTGATVATPSVITCAAAHDLNNGDQVQITGIVGTTTDNATAFVSVQSSTTFALYSDSALTVGITGTGTYVSGGIVTEAADISAITGNGNVALTITSLTALAKVLIYVQTSTDGFVSDIRTLGIVNVVGPITSDLPVTYRWSLGLWPSSYFGVTNGRLRLYVKAIDSSSSVTTSMVINR